MLRLARLQAAPAPQGHGKTFGGKRLGDVVRHAVSGFNKARMAGESAS